VIRVHERVFRGRQVDTVRRVNKTVLGSHVVGTSHTRGNVRVDLSHADHNAAFYVVFSGQTRTRTVGHNGPALIDSRTETQFTAARRVTFTPLEGFKSEPTSLRSSTRLIIEGARSTRPGLRGRIVRRVALRRARETHAQAENIAYNDSHREIQYAFDRSLDARVARLNKRTEVIRYATALLGRDSQELDVQVSSSHDCVQFAIGREQSEKAGIDLPTEASPDTPLEIWVHSSALRDRLPALTEAFTLVADPAHPMRGTVPMLQALSVGNDDGQDGPAIQIQDDWVVLALDPNEEAKRAARGGTGLR
jgi:hypothetical protein